MVILLKDILFIMYLMYIITLILTIQYHIMLTMLNLIVVNINVTDIRIQSD